MSNKDDMPLQGMSPAISFLQLDSSFYNVLGLSIMLSNYESITDEVSALMI